MCAKATEKKSMNAVLKVSLQLLWYWQALSIKCKHLLSNAGC